MNQSTVDANSKKSIVIALIHNNDINRSDYLIPLMKELEEKIRDKYKCFRSNFGFQPKLDSDKFWRSFLARYFLMKVQIKWNNYIELNFVLQFMESIKIFSLMVYKFFFNNKEVRKYTEIERYIAAKHIRSWSHFLESNANYLIVFEDDIIFKKNSIDKTLKILDKADSYHNQLPLYIDLAGGFSDEDIGIKSLIIQSQNGYSHFSRPVTNTVCGYLINRSFAKILIRHINLDSKLSFLPIDWCINKIFIDLEKRSEFITCFHASPTIYIHGSMNRYYKEWRT
jgi:hypothetical protein